MDQLSDRFKADEGHKTAGPHQQLDRAGVLKKINTDKAAELNIALGEDGKDLPGALLIHAEVLIGEQQVGNSHIAGNLQSLFACLADEIHRTF